jgi:hypothetical protein
LMNRLHRQSHASTYLYLRFVNWWEVLCVNTDWNNF